MALIGLHTVANYEDALKAFPRSQAPAWECICAYSKEMKEIPNG